VTLAVRPFDDGDVEAAGRLLAARHAEHRRHEPLLDPQFEDDNEATAEVAAAWSADGASGAVALQDGQHIGYLLGSPKSDPTWGANVWVEAAGVAARVAETVERIPPPAAWSSSYFAPPARSENSSTRSPPHAGCV